MADKNLLRENNPSIEVYRSNDAAPDNWEDAKFWLINELRRIQNGFYSVDEVIATLDTAVEAVEQPDGTGSQGPQGPAGPQGPQGPAGPPGPPGTSVEGPTEALIADYKIALDFTWSSQKIAEELSNVGVQGDSSISIGATPPSGSATGDLWFDNTYTLELYVWDGLAWISTTGTGGGSGEDSRITNSQIANWDTAYGWGDHSQQGYITSQNIDGGASATLYGIDQTIDGGVA